MKTQWMLAILITLLTGFNSEPARSDHHIVQVNFVPWEQMMQHCLPANARSLGCYADGQVWMTEALDLKGHYTLALAMDFISWKDLGRVCDEPACEIDGTIQAHQSFNEQMNCSVGEIVFRNQDWPEKMYNTQCILGHEIVHAFGGSHPQER